MTAADARTGLSPQRLAVGLALTAVAALALAGLALFLWPSVPPSTVLIADLPQQPFEARPFRHDFIDGWLVRQEDGSLRAFWARSPHLGCYVDYVAPDGSRNASYLEFFKDLAGGGGFIDLCGNIWYSYWTLEGDRVCCPAPRGLDRFDVRLVDGAVELDLGRVRLGACSPAVASERATRRCSLDDDPMYANGPARTGQRARMLR
jgi:hypothetical protein